jgi:CheY-like chemotaxis protein
MAKARIMIVEDEAIIATAIKMDLQDMGYEVTSIVHSGEKAVSEAKKEKPDLILMDIALAGEMDGIEAAEKIHFFSDIPIIYITAYSDEEMVKKAKFTEPYGYIIKPAKERDLRISVEIALYKHKMEMERKKLTQELKEAIANIKVLRGLLPICAWCKKVRDDEGYWEQVEAYVETHADVKFSHGICPECFKKVKEEADKLK